MSLKITVKVSEINNLSDARYCAGMGVDMIGFTLDENHPKFIEISKIAEISNWISGIKVVGEFAGNNIDNINYLAEQLNLDYVQVDPLHLSSNQLLEIKFPLIIKLKYSTSFEYDALKFIKLTGEQLSYILLTEFGEIDEEKLLKIKIISEKIPVILEENPGISVINSIIDHTYSIGINLTGGSEIKPGFKDFSDLSEILEFLEESN